MPYTAGDRVMVTSQSSEHRTRLGTVEVAASESEHGFNKVRLDGHAPGRTFNLADNELGPTNFSTPVQYPE